MAPRIAVRAAEYDLPAGLVAALDVHLRAHAAGDRLLDTLTEVVQIRAESGWPPLAAPIGQILASQALLNILSARRYGTVLDEFRMLVEGGYGATPAPIEESVSRAVALVTGSGGGLDEDPPSAEDVREAAEGLAASEEDLVLLAMFGEEAETLLQAIRAAPLARDVAPRWATSTRRAPSGSASSSRSCRSRASGRSRSRTTACASRCAAPTRPGGRRRRRSLRCPEERRAGAAACRQPARRCASSRRWSASSTARRRPGRPAFVEVGDVVTVGQTLCLLEAMKLFNELKAEHDGRVKAIHVESGQPVEFGQLLFELEPVDDQPIV